MLESIPVVLFIGSVLGFLAGIGVGGGSLLILWLTFLLGMEHQDARLLNLLFFLPSAIVASIFRWRQGSLAIKKVLPAILFGCLFAGGFAFMSIHMDTGVLKKLFGGLLLFTGIRELTYKPKRKVNGQT